MRFLRSRQEIMSLLAEEAKLMEIVKLIGSDVLPRAASAAMAAV